MKTSELTGAQLDWAVAKCEGIEYVKNDIRFSGVYSRKYSTDWARGGAIIEREKIDVWTHAGKVWAASTDKGYTEYRGTTPLIAAMRCYVASKLGDEVELPEEL
jgi:hypothetical protein